MGQHRSTRYSYFELVERYDSQGETLIERGRVLDISESGMLYKGEVMLSVGERCKFRFEAGGDYFFVDGVVARTSRHPVDKKPLAGVKLSLTDLQKEKLIENLKRLKIKPVP
jgi:hypothetical protein